VIQKATKLDSEQIPRDRNPTKDSDLGKSLQSREKYYEQLKKVFNRKNDF